MHLTAFNRPSSLTGKITPQIARVMKLVAILLLAAGITASGNGKAQNITIQEKNAPLKKVLNEVRVQSGLSLVYTLDMIGKADRVTVSVRNATVQEAMDAILKGLPLTYTIVNKTIVIKEATPAPSDSFVGGEKITPPPPITVKGRIVNENGEPVTGASVQVKGDKAKGTTTDANGYFELRGVDEDATLIITGTNIEDYHIKINGKTDLATLSMKTRVVEGESVTVNTGYQKLKPNEVTGSVVVITKEQLEQRVATDIISKLEGITNGLVFNKDPGSGSNMLRIRGESTIFANPDPLIIVDKFPYDGDINNINPNDVENITILKDAAAASIYGVQAGNGVIVITTKKGSTNRPLIVELNANTTVSGKPDLFYSPQIGSSDFIDLETFLFSKGKYNADLNNSSKIAVSPVVEILNKRRTGQITAADSAMQIDELRNIDFRNDLLKYYYRNSFNQQYQINLSGGTSKIRYFFSGGYDRGLPNIKGNSNSRITLNSQNTYRPFQKLEFSLGVSYNESITSNNAGNANISKTYPYTQLIDANGNQISIPQLRADFEDSIGNHNFLNWKFYPLQEINYYENRSKSYDMRILTGLTFSILNGLNADVSFQYHRTIAQGRFFTSKESYYIRNLINKFAILDSSGNYVGSNYPDGGFLSLSNSYLTGYYGRAGFDFNRKFGNHSIAAIAGFEVRQTSTESNESNYYGYDNENGSYTIPNLFASYPTYPDGGSASLSGGISSQRYLSTIDRFRSYFANASYIYKDKYMIFASSRFDGSNYFGVSTNQKNLPLWSAGFKWDISKESFYRFRQIPVLSFRVSFGYNGNLDKNIAAITTFIYRGNDFLTGKSYAGINNIPNPELRWEKTEHLNLGINFGTLNKRISGSIEYFRKKGDDLIGDAPIDPTTGVDRLRGNFSGMLGSGIDIQLRSQNIVKKINWSTILNFCYASERVTRYDIPPQVGGAYLTAYSRVLPFAGKPLYGLFSYKWGGLDPINGNPMIYLGDTLTKSYSAATVNSIAIDDLVYNGRYNPPITGSLMNSVIWNNLSININITYKLNYFFRRGSINYTSLVGNWRNGHSDYALRWRTPGDEISTNIPSLVYPTNSRRDQYYNQSDILVEKGDHIRLQFININYSLKDKLLRKIAMKGLQFYVYLNNIGILWKANKQGIDPDYPYLNYPPAKTYAVGIKATF